ncbi:MAG: pyridoxal-phosphate dependent enzyme [Candidatus Hydrogenedens sp.]|nr:pyridoxal-phosphate dependent enzyme [Candidatus Hydrogenedens sp.]
MSPDTPALPALFRAYPMLQSVAWQPIPLLPTPVLDGSHAFTELGMDSFHVKCDDQTHSRQGGNKIRKLAFLLSWAKRQGMNHVMTFGAAGSNHTLATALCAHEQGMKSSLLLGPQHNSTHLRENLLGYPESAALIPAEWPDFTSVSLRLFHQIWQEDGAAPFIIPAGGSSVLGTLGYVDAAFELKVQIEEGLLPEPDCIYMAAGTMGSCAGLAFGIQAVGLKSKVLAIRVTGTAQANRQKAEHLARGALHTLRSHDPSFPILHPERLRMKLRDEYFGQDYALFTPEAVAAVEQAKSALGLHLEVYTGKAFAALLGDGAAGTLKGKKVLFWNTHGVNSQSPSESANNGKWKSLPKGLHHYFTKPLQPLDREG